ncbi:MAG TPA: hypothetical protein VHG52_08730 [Thermomicrobiales bacterium]|nr:hypothetical protein [Thermomicrobiales bacterium]
MAQTRGFVQRLKVTSTFVMAWAYIGPTPTNTELLIILAPAGLTADEAAFRGAMVDTLAAAMVNQTELVASHDDNKAEITQIQIPPP